MEDVDIYSLLRIILKKLEGTSVVWRVDGSANLRLQGVDVRVRDLDIKTNVFGLRVFKKALRDYLVTEGFKDEVQGDVVAFSIDGFPVEVINNKYNMLHRVKKISLQGMVLPVLPLREAREFYVALGREKTVQVIDRYISVTSF